MALKLQEGCFPAEVVGGVRAAGLTLTETAYAARAHLPRHSHDRACFVVVLSGGFREVYEGRGRVCGPLTVIFRPPHETHSDRFDERGARCLNVELSEEWVRRVGAHTRALDDSADFRGPAFADLAARLSAEYRRMDAASPLAIEGLLLGMVAQATRRSPDRPARNPPLWLGRAEELLRAEFRGPLTLSRVASELGVHPVHLAAAFHRAHGCTVGEYLRRLRVEYARERLAGSDEPVITIALAAGFYDQSHFTRTFKRHTGLTPAAYRAALRAT